MSLVAQCMCHQAARYAGQSNVTFGLVSFSLVPQSVCASVYWRVQFLGCLRTPLSMCAHILGA